MSLDKVQKFYIEKNNGVLSSESLAKDLGVSVRVVNNYIAKLPKEEPKKAKKVTARDYMITEGVGGQKGVAVMTGAGSAIGEKPKQSNANSLRNKDCITKIYND